MSDTLLEEGDAAAAKPADYVEAAKLTSNFDGMVTALAARTWSEVIVNASVKQAPDYKPTYQTPNLGQYNKQELATLGIGHDGILKRNLIISADDLKTLRQTAKEVSR